MSSDRGEVSVAREQTLPTEDGEQLLGLACQIRTVREETVRRGPPRHVPAQLALGRLERERVTTCGFYAPAHRLEGRSGGRRVRGLIGERRKEEKLRQRAMGPVGLRFPAGDS